MLLQLASLSLFLIRTSCALALVSYGARPSWRGGALKGIRLPVGIETPRKLPPYQTTPRLWTCTTTTTSLNGISEWRDIVSVRDSVKIQTKELPPLAKEICVLPFPYQEVLLQGETKQLRLYEERFVQLFADCMEHHGGVVAMGLLASNLGLVQSVPLAEIEAYNHVPGFGIFCTLRVVARANLIDIVQETPYIKAICTELTDQVPSNLEEYVKSLLESTLSLALTVSGAFARLVAAVRVFLSRPNLFASHIENYMLLLSSMEHRLETAKLQEGVDDPNDVDLVMKQRLLIARLEDTYYEENIDNDSADDEDDEDSSQMIDRRRRFRRAYEVALSTDTQGYQTVSSSLATTNNGTDYRSARELTAISWAALETDLLPDEADASVRIQALASDKLTERLALAYKSLRIKKARLRQRMENAGLSCGGDDDDDDGDQDKSDQANINTGES